MAVDKQPGLRSHLRRPVRPFHRAEPGAARWGWKEIANPQPEGPKVIWVKARPDALEPIAPHEGRHSAASYLIEAGLNDLGSPPRSPQRLADNKRIYGHLFPDSRATIAAKLDAYQASGSSTERLTDSVSGIAPQERESPGLSGAS
jgi:hypothetical protein